MELDRVSSNDFRPHVGSAVTLTAPDGQQFVLEISSVRDLEKAPRPGALRMAFSVEMKGAPELRLPQQIYRFDHATLGTAELFIVPLQPDVYGSKFEALFN